MFDNTPGRFMAASLQVYAVSCAIQLRHLRCTEIPYRSESSVENSFSSHKLVSKQNNIEGWFNSWW